VGRYPAREYGEPWWPSKLYWATWSRESMVKVRRQMSGDLGAEDVEEPAAGSMDAHISATIDVREHFDRKHRALLAHDTQFAADSWLRTLPGELLASFLGYESYWLVHATVECDPADPDLLAGT
jgi:LmbE family N-acetylglucosaminyl deacetylase